MRVETFHQNKKIYLSYNNFRKHIFSDLAPKDSEVILYMLPWMLSMNDPDVPGYLADLETPIAVYGIHTDSKVLKREADFRKMLKSGRPLSLVSTPANATPIQAIYTIGSIGTISQTSASDCDTWICVDRKDFPGNRFDQLIQKTNLIKGWLDNNIRIPVYFFICDINDIRTSNFGSVDQESAGSTQKNTLKEEFYRTAVMIAGKIPLWWLCFDREGTVRYVDFLEQYLRGDFGDGDCLDLGPLDS